MVIVACCRWTAAAAAAAAAHATPPWWSCCIGARCILSAHEIVDKRARFPFLVGGKGHLACTFHRGSKKKNMCWSKVGVGVQKLKNVADASVLQVNTTLIHTA